MKNTLLIVSFIALLGTSCTDSFAESVLLYEEIKTSLEARVDQTNLTSKDFEIAEGDSVINSVLHLEEKWNLKKSLPPTSCVKIDTINLSCINCIEVEYYRPQSINKRHSIIPSNRFITNRTEGLA